MSIVDLSNKEQKSLKTRNKFHSQFTLNTNEYRDNNNFIRIIEGSNRYNRFNPFETEEEIHGHDYT